MEKTIHKYFKVVKAKAQKVSVDLNRLRARAGFLAEDCLCPSGGTTGRNKTNWFGQNYWIYSSKNFPGTFNTYYNL